jgi:hypothetical protein
LFRKWKIVLFWKQSIRTIWYRDKSINVPIELKFFKNENLKEIVDMNSLLQFVVLHIDLIPRNQSIQLGKE